MSNVKPTPEKPLTIVKDCFSGKVVLPEFQRNFVWTNNDIQDLLVSLLNDYFVGTFLLLRRGQEFDFQVRYIEGLNLLNRKLNIDVDEKLADKAILDGQQRLTSLFYAIYHPPSVCPKGTSYPHRYFADVSEFMSVKKPTSWDKSNITAFSENDTRRNLEIEINGETRGYSFKEILEKSGSYGKMLEEKWFKNHCFEKGLVPFSSLKDRDALSTWKDEYTSYFLKKGEAFDSIQKRTKSIESAFNSWFDFEIPVLTLENKSFADVAEIFERINRTGVQLSVFALATAVYFKKGINLRDWWFEYYNSDESPIPRFCEIEDEEFPKFILQVVALNKNKDVKKNVLLDSKSFSFTRSDWDEACGLMDQALIRLENTRTGYGVFKSKFLPYKTITVSLAGLLKKVKTSEDYKKVDSWYWSSVFTGRYAGSSDTAIKQDYDSVNTWLNDKNKPPVAVVRAKAEISTLDLSKVKQGAIYKSILNAMALNGPKDFYSVQSIELGLLNDHHIFPKKSGLKLTDENSISNRTLISESTNKSILNKKPSEYMGEVKNKFSDDESCREMLRTHLIEGEAVTALKEDKYDEFTLKRGLLIKNMLGSLISYD